jgi:hypothetical protein
VQSKFIKKEFKKTKSPIAYKNRKGVEGTMEGLLKDIEQIDEAEIKRIVGIK